MDIKEKIKQLEKEINKLQTQIDEDNAYQMAFKLILNSVYGAFANRYFILSNSDIANAITAMGRDIISHMDEKNTIYWRNYWHKDTKLHEILGLKNPPNPIDVDKTPPSQYCDTDSLFVNFEPAMISCNWNKDPEEFVHLVNKHRLSGYFNFILKEYAKNFGVKNIQDFELERISESVIFFAKKKYIQNVVFEDGQKHERLSYILPKGVKLIQSSTPLFAREKLKDIVKYILDTHHTLDIMELSKKVHELKEEFKQSDIEDISHMSSVNGYEKYVIDDREKIAYKTGTPHHIKAAIYYNYLLNQNPQMQRIYTPITSGMKIKYYQINDKEHPVGSFAYQRGFFPKEFAPDIEWDRQFEKSILKDINDFNEVLGLPQINDQLRFRIGLFQ